MKDESLMQELMNESFDFKKIKKGDILKGEIISSSQDEVIVNINYFCDGIIKKNNLSKDLIEGKTYLKGEQINVYVVSLDDGEGNILLSEKEANRINAFNELKKIYKSHEVVEVFVKEIISSGAICDFMGLRGFIPKSRISMKKRDLNEYLNKNLEVILIELDIPNNRIVFSHKEIEERELSENRKSFLSKVVVGDKFSGVVKNIKDFGIFVDIDGVQGFVHKSQMSYKRRFNTNDLVKVGDRVDVYVLNYDEENDKLSLTMKDSNYSPFSFYKNDFVEGGIYEARIFKIVSSGLIVSLNDELTGFIHVSELPNDIKSLDKSFKVGDVIKAKVLSINLDEEKISLSNVKAFEDEKKFDYVNDDDSNTTLGDMFKDVFSKFK